MPTPEPYVDPLDTTFQLEVDVQRKNTTAFIMSHSISIEIERDTWISDGAGGKRRNPAPTRLSPQIVRFIPSNFGTTTGNTHREEGQIVTNSYAVLAEWNADIEKGDEFMVGTKRFVIDSVQEPEGAAAVYEKMAEAISFA